MIHNYNNFYINNIEMIENICPPALIYLIYSLVQIVIDSLKGLYNTAFIKIWVMILFTALLNILCERGLGVISWIIVFLPFIFMALITTILLVSFGLDPASGKIFTKEESSDATQQTDSNLDTTLPYDGQYVLNEFGLTHAHPHTHSDGTNHAHLHTHSDPSTKYHF